MSRQDILKLIIEKVEKNNFYLIDYEIYKRIKELEYVTINDDLKRNDIVMYNLYSTSKYIAYKRIYDCYRYIKQLDYELNLQNYKDVINILENLGYENVNNLDYYKLNIYIQKLIKEMENDL